MRKYNKKRHREKTHEKYPVPKEGIITDLVYFGVRKNRKIWRDSYGSYYSWDSLHGDFEVFNITRNHTGSKDIEGKQTKPAVKGRKLDV